MLKNKNCDQIQKLYLPLSLMAGMSLIMLSALRMGYEVRKDHLPAKRLCVESNITRHLWHICNIYHTDISRNFLFLTDDGIVDNSIIAIKMAIQDPNVLLPVADQWTCTWLVGIGINSRYSYNPYSAAVFVTIGTYKSLFFLYHKSETK